MTDVAKLWWVNVWTQQLSDDKSEEEGDEEENDDEEEEEELESNGSDEDEEEDEDEESTEEISNDESEQASEKAKSSPVGLRPKGSDFVTDEEEQLLEYAVSEVEVESEEEDEEENWTIKTETEQESGLDAKQSDIASDEASTLQQLQEANVTKQASTLEFAEAEEETEEITESASFPGRQKSYLSSGMVRFILIHEFYVSSPI